MPDFRFEAPTGRYRGEDGKLVGFRAVPDAVDRTVDEASARLGRLAERLRFGEIALGAWQRDAVAVIKDAHVAAGIAAHSGIGRMDQETWGAIGRRIRNEYGYLRDFEARIADGRQPLNGRLDARLKVYGQAARATYESVPARDQRARSATFERNVLSPGEHCASCRAQSELGWVAVGALIPIGARSCRSNCRCRIGYSFKAEVAA